MFCRHECSRCGCFVGCVRLLAWTREDGGGLARFEHLKLLRRADVSSSITFSTTILSVRGEDAVPLSLSAALDIPLAPCSPGAWLDSSNPSAVQCRYGWRVMQGGPLPKRN